jgi:hypothetical protein
VISRRQGILPKAKTTTVLRRVRQIDKSPIMTAVDSSKRSLLPPYPNTSSSRQSAAVHVMVFGL